MTRRRLRFGAFVPPNHVPVNQNPTYSLQRDVEIIQLMDSMGFEEAWVGEHHSFGVEPVGDPFPHHNPLWAAAWAPSPPTRA
jgi:limonene 1,2-monooxygenase